MTKDELVAALAPTIGRTLASDLVKDFLAIRQDVLTGTLERAIAGKFVETVVQVLQYIERGGTFDARPNVDDYLAKLPDRAVQMDDGLRIVASRVARTMYTLRNKRNIAHKGAVDPNRFDQALLHHTAQWMMAELLRNARGISMEDAGRLIDLVQEPVGGLVEDLGGRKLVLHDTTTENEVLILLHNVYPKGASQSALIKWMDRRKPDTVKKAVRGLWVQKLIDGTPDDYRLTSPGYAAANEVIGRLVASAASAIRK